MFAIWRSNINNNKLFIFSLIFLVFVFSYYLLKSLYFPPHDFANYYYGAYFLREGAFTLNTYEIIPFNQSIKEIGRDDIFGNFYPNTPFLAFIFIPLSYLPLEISKFVFNLASLVLFAVALYRIVTIFPDLKRYAILVPLLFITPIGSGILTGQVYFLVFYLLIEGYVHFKKHPLLSSFLWAVAILIKIFPLIVVAFLFINGRYKQSLHVVALVIFLGCVSLAYVDVDLWRYFISVVLEKSNRGEITGEYVINYQSLHMFFKYMFFEGKTLIDGDDLFANTFFFSALLYVKLMALIIGYCLQKYERSFGDGSRYTFAYWMLAAIVLTPYDSSYSKILLILPFMAFFNRERNKYETYVFIGLLLFVANVPKSVFYQFNYPLNFTYLFAMLGLAYVYIRQFNILNRWMFTIPVLPALLISYIRAINTDHVCYIANELTDEKIVSDYVYNPDGSIIYRYWGKDGKEHEVNIDFLPYQSTQSELDIIQNQIYLNGRQLTNDDSEKINPILTNNKVILLTDYGRGIGFYQFKEIPIDCKLK